MNLERRAGGLHRPVPVHMSSLAEKGGEEENDQMDEVEVNQNYKQYAKATPVARTLEEEQSDEQEKGSFSSCISTPRGKGSIDLLRTSLVSVESGGWMGALVGEAMLAIILSCNRTCQLLLFGKVLFSSCGMFCNSWRSIARTINLMWAIVGPR